MFLVHIPQGAKTLPGRVRQTALLLHQGLLERKSYQVTLYMGISKALMHPKYCRVYTVEERDMMHQYASSKLFGDGTPPTGTPALLISKVDGLYSAERSHYRRSHPYKGRRMAAAA